MQRKIPLALSFDDVLLVPQYSEIETRSKIDISTRLTPRIKLQIPLLSANMSDVTGVKMAITLGKLGGLGVLPRFNSIEYEADMVYKVKKAKVKVAASVGCKDWEERAEKLIKAGADVLFLDVAHGHLKKAIETTRNLKMRFGSFVDIVSGNVATRQGAIDLFKAGADSVKVGIGPGSICTTRIVTGCGVPQITAIFEASKAARLFKKTLIADGGTKNSGDVVKALAAGANAVMIGNQFAGYDEAPGKMIKKDGILYKSYNASTSFTEKKNHILSQQNNLNKDFIKQIEGIESLVLYKGPLNAIIEKMVANIRSGFSYCGAKNIKELHKNASFIRMTASGLRESKPHDVIENQS